MFLRSAVLASTLIALLPLHAAAADKNYEPIAYAYIMANGDVAQAKGRSKVLVERPSKGNYCVLLQKDLQDGLWWVFLPALVTPAEPGAEVFMLAASTGYREICHQYEKDDYRDGDWFAVHVTIKNLEGKFVNKEFNILVP